MPFRRLLLVLLLLLSQSLPAAAQAPAVVSAMRVIPTAEGVTVRVSLTQPLAVVPKAFALNEPMRWAIDIPGASSARPSGRAAANPSSSLATTPGSARCWST